RRGGVRLAPGRSGGELVIIHLFLAAALTVHQGSAVIAKIPDERHVKAVDVSWRNERVPAVRNGGEWTTILGIDLDAKPGNQAASVSLTMDDGRVERRQLT